MGRPKKDAHAPEPQAVEPTAGYGDESAPRVEDVTDWTGKAVARPFAFEGADMDPKMKHALAVGHTPDKLAAMKGRLKRKGYRPVPSGKDVYMRGVPNGEEGAEVWYTTPEIAAKHLEGRRRKDAERLRQANLATIEGQPLSPHDVVGRAGDSDVRPEVSMTMRGPMRDQLRRAEDARANRNANLSEI